MRVACVADGFHPFEEGGPVKAIRNYIGRHRLGERRPTRTGLKLLGSVEQNRVAAKAGIDARLKEAAHLRAEGALGAGLTRHVIFLGAELLAPLGVCLYDFAIRCRIAVLGEAQNIGPFQDHDLWYR